MEHVISITLNLEDYKKYTSGSIAHAQNKYDSLPETFSNLTSNRHLDPPNIACWNCEAIKKGTGFYLLDINAGFMPNGRLKVIAFFCNPICCKTYLHFHGLMKTQGSNFDGSLYYQTTFTSSQIDVYSDPKHRLAKYGIGVMSEDEYAAETQNIFDNISRKLNVS